MAVLSRDEVTDVFGSAPVIITLVLPIVIGVVLLLKCILNHCCARKTTTKDEMFGVEGRMTILPNAESTFVPMSTTLSTTPAAFCSVAPANSVTNHRQSDYQTSPIINKRIPVIAAVTDVNVTDVPVVSAGPTTPSADGIHLPFDSYETIDLTDSLTRSSIGQTHRQLPQIPLQVSDQPRRSSSVASHDGTSELYATVWDETTPLPSSSNAVKAGVHHYSSLNPKYKRPGLTSASRSLSLEDGPNKSEAQNEPTPSSDSETYATAHHPYARLKKNIAENPYARVRTASTVNDEETDTDNYDLPQPYVQTRGRSHNSANGQPTANEASGSRGNALREDVNLNSVDNGAGPAGPLPPRRPGRQWRRTSHPQAPNNDNQVHFSGDSQDSRGYTSISVREPLSNLRSQVSNTRQYDSHYATVSDDSEDMYAAIEDGNYMKIAGEDDDLRRSWLAGIGVGVASPIPERREANSPLPPVPFVPIAPPSDVNPPLTAASTNSTAPVYAQVVKKSKKNKAPLTPTVSNTSTSSQIRESDHPLPGPSTQNTPHSSHAAIVGSHRLKHRHTIMENSNVVAPLEPNLSEVRRWSKADISYSEFEVVRESTFGSGQDTRSSSMLPGQDTAQEVLDEDNYNVIAEKKPHKDSHRSNMDTSPNIRHGDISLDNYQEIQQVSNPYQEIEPKSADHYQEISPVIPRLNGDADVLYQEIGKPVKTFEDEDDEEDQFYERVKPSATIKKSDSPDSLDKKHGYEKLKKKSPAKLAVPGQSGAVGSASDDDDDEDGKLYNNDSLYEQVKYPPYERLQESRDDLTGQNDSLVSLDELGVNLYEDIGYSKVKKKFKKETTDTEKNNPPKENILTPQDHTDSIAVASAVDVDQLYARVDKSRKTKSSGARRIDCVSVADNEAKRMNTVVQKPNVSSSSGQKLKEGSQIVDGGEGYFLGIGHNQTDRSKQRMELFDDSTIEYI